MKQSISITSTRPTSVLRIACGSYDRLLFGYAVDPSEPNAEQLFAFGAHSSCVRCCRILPRRTSTLVTGGDDEVLRVYSMDTLSALGELLEHEAAVQCMDFHAGSHMLSGDAAGAVILWCAAEWRVLKHLRGHKTSVVGISFHPSGRLALSVSVDRWIICWNLLKGNNATKERLHKVPCDIRFSPTGIHYAILFDKSLAVRRTITVSLDPEVTVEYIPEANFSLDTRFNCFLFLSDTKIALGCDDGSIRLLNLDKSEISEFVMVQSPRENPQERIRALSTATTTLGLTYISAASSDGRVKIWELNNDDTFKPLTIEPFIILETSSRLTCLTMDAVDGFVDDENEIA